MPGIDAHEQEQVNVSGEKRYEEVYGDTFAMYSRKEMEEFIEPFIVRFKRNGLDASRIFNGKKCFDAGCGNGRGTLFMLMNGAEHVTSYDFCEKNIESTRKFVKDFGFDQVDTKQGTLEKIPYPDETFDFVWCNGVIMHTDHPNQCLAEITRVLKTGGQAWLYIYGSGGVYWRIIYHLRDMLRNIPIQKTISTLKAMRYPTRYIAEFIDDWYATNLRSYTHRDLSRRLVELGFEEPNLLNYGMDYDTSHRRNTFLSERERLLMGEGDLRYLLLKTSCEQKDKCQLEEGEYGSIYNWSDEITAHLDPIFHGLSAKVSNTDLGKIMAAAYIQRELRIELTESKEFDFDKVIKILGNITAYINEL
ncbi:MAG: class I SAM-dependent methyltransferase [Candidatus Omnitrophota bacterium]